MSDHYDPWLDLVERFAARGADIRVGSMQPSMIRHLLDTVEEQDVRLRGIEDKLISLRKDLGDAA